MIGSDAVDFLLDNAQMVAFVAEEDRCASLRPKCTSTPIATMPKPSRKWAEAWAAAVLSSPLLVGDARAELIFGLLWAFRESSYQDALIGDHGVAFCSFQVRVVGVSHFGSRGAELNADPAKCIREARWAMAWSFKQDPDHPMAAYAGCRVTISCPPAEARSIILKALLLKLPAVKETP